jgi:hypothetical protein
MLNRPILNVSNMEQVRYNSHSALPRTTCTDQSNEGARPDRDRETAKHWYIRPGWIPEMNVLKADMATDVLELLAFGRFGIYLGHGINQFHNIGGCTLR